MNIWRISCHGQSFPEANAADELSFNCIYSGRCPLGTVFLSAYNSSVKTLRRCLSEQPSLCANSGSLFPLLHSHSISLAAESAILDDASTGDNPGACSGLQVIHGLKPAASASAAVLKNRQFSSFGILARQTVRQYMPVDVTPTK